MPREYAFCPQCGDHLGKKVIHGLDRQLCASCGFVFWQNPVVGVAVIVMQDERILLGRRSRGEYRGLWCIPCGYVEYDEDVRAAARREFFEETGLEVELGKVFTVHSNFHNPKMHSVGIWFLGQVAGGTLKANDDLDEVDFFSLEQPLPALAFATDREVLDELLQIHCHEIRND